MEPNEIAQKEKSLYELYAYFTIYRIINDINELNRNIDEINKVIKEKENKKISLNFARNNTVKGLSEEIEYKKGLIDEAFINDELKLSRYLFLLQLIQEPMYYSFSEKKFRYKEEQYEFSLSNISSFLGFENKFYLKIEENGKKAAKNLLLNFNDLLFSAFKLNHAVLDIISPFSLPTVGDPGVTSINLIDKSNAYQGVNLINLLTLIDVQSVVTNKLVPSHDIQKDIFSMDEDEIETYGFVLVLIVQYLISLHLELADSLKMLLIENFINWKQAYEKGILLGSLNESNPKLPEIKLDLAEDIRHTIIALLNNNY